MKKSQKLIMTGFAWLMLNGVPVFADSGLPDGEGLKNGAVQLGGNILIIVAIIGVISALVTQRWARLVTLFIGGALAAWIIWLPDSFIAFLKNLVEAFGG
ncbi:MAG: hypothetical protein L0K82_06900 [Pisciglobus halotolerans]|nr:hypothetical protein [Tetragenococcus koreensis]MDN6270567.1 hypothetical protein [Tetragenococcus koreensis]MDN6502021.1 hypothetical protein [Tetragenococcus koreensis]MDN6626927.1 hypothetical protein [Pisciglobus halotolerans]